MPEEERQEGGKAPDLSLEAIIKKCMDAEGYVVFAGILTNKVDAEGNRQIDFEYRRFHLAFEDVRSAIIKFKEAYQREVNEGLEG